MSFITETYAAYAQDHPEKIALQTLKEEISYQDWHMRVCQTANWLESLNLSNKTAGFLLANDLPFLQLFAGASMAGWIAVPFDPRWKKEEILQRLAISLPSVVITTREMHAELCHVYPNILIWEECLEAIMKCPAVAPDKLGEDLPFYMGFTSGTTGIPKAFVRSQDSWTASFVCNRVDFQMGRNDHVLIPGPLIHSHFLYGAISTLYLGGTVYLLEKFTPSGALAAIQTHPVTAVYVVPTMVEAFLREKFIIERPLTIISSGAKWEENTKQQIRYLFPQLSMYEFYGASELSFVSFLSDADNLRRPGSVGKPFHNVEIEIRLPDGELAKPKQTGKIYVRSKMLFLGYLTAEGCSIQSIADKDGWITVDDMGYLDEDGFLYISGREKNMILYGGINIFPEEIEKVLSLHPDVEDAAVVGLADPYWGQIAVAFIKGKAAKLDLKRLCRKNLSAYKIPRRWYYVEEMPYTLSGKIARLALKELLESKVISHE